MITGFFHRSLVRTVPIPSTVVLVLGHATTVIDDIVLAE